MRTYRTPRLAIRRLSPPGATWPLVLSLAVFASATPASLSAQAAEPPHVHQAAEKLGTVSFPNSGAADAQPDFLRGLALLHNFEYGDAARAFRSAEQRDPAFAIAYWLDAMTYSHMLWGEEDLAGARAVLALLGPTSAARLSKAKTPRERAYGAAVEAFLAPTDERTRARSFADSMRHVAEAYPKDLEAHAFTALAIMLAADHAASRDESSHLYLEAASYANHVFREQPQHPGAAHYLIHAYDDPARAANGLEAARAYARIAPSAEHAQHMPSHIFVQLGYWDDAARSNEQAWVSSRLQVKREHAPPTALGFHTLNWLQYAYLQQGRYRAARALVDTARAVLAGADLRSSDRPDARYAVSQLEFRYMRETGAWNAWKVAPMDTNELRLPQSSSARTQTMASGHVFETAIIFAMRGDTMPLAIVTRRMHEQLDRRGTNPPAGARARLATFDALLARARGDRNSAISLLQSAEAAADSSPPIGPPHLLLLHELLGSVLFDAGRFADAAAAYTRGLAVTPNRSSLLLGLARAGQRSGNSSAAEDAYAHLQKNWAHADSEVRATASGGRPR